MDKTVDAETRLEWDDRDLKSLILVSVRCWRREKLAEVLV